MDDLAVFALIFDGESLELLVVAFLDDDIVASISNVVTRGVGDYIHFVDMVVDFLEHFRAEDVGCEW